METKEAADRHSKDDLPRRLGPGPSYPSRIQARAPRPRHSPASVSAVSKRAMLPAAMSATSRSGRTRADRTRADGSNGAVSRRIDDQIQEELGQPGLEGESRVVSHDLHRLGASELAAIRTLRGQRVVDVRDGYDTGAHGHAVSLQSIWIAAAIVTLGVVADDERGVGKELEGRHDLRPGEGVPAHGDPLLIRERALLSQDVLGHTDLAQVVEQPRLCDGLGL